MALTTTGEIAGVFEKVTDRVIDALKGVSEFASVESRDGMIVCTAKETPEPVEYRLFIEDGALWVSWSTEDRWLSQSVEADLVFTGDDLNDMIDEEIVDLGWDHGRLEGNEHFRSEDKRYTFRSKINLDAAGIEKAGTDLVFCAQAYDIVFCELGDMKGDEEG